MEAVLAPHYHREGDTLVVVERHFPTVTVPEMLEDGFLDVELMLVGLFGGPVKGLFKPVPAYGGGMTGRRHRSGVLRDILLGGRDGPACHQNQYKKQLLHFGSLVIVLLNGQ